MATLAFPTDLRDQPEMVHQRRAYTGQFERDTVQAITPIKKLVGEIIQGLGVHRPVDLKDLLNLDATLSWQLFKIATEINVLTIGAAMPSRASIEKFASAAAARGSLEKQAKSLSKAYEKFESVVARHAGDRTTFISLATSAAGVTSDWLATDLQHRRHVYRGLSHAMGIQARARIICQILGNEAVPSENGYRFANISGHINIRTLRQIDRVRVYGSTVIATPEDPDTRLVQRRPLDPACENALLKEFCSEPLPELVFESGLHGRYQWAVTSMVSPEVGNLGVSTVMFGEDFCSPTTPQECTQRTNIPCEELLIDLLAPVGRMAGDPSAELFLGESPAVIQSSEKTPLLGKYSIEKLGTGTSVLEAPEMAQYGEMVHAVGIKMGFPIETYEVWRLRVEFPIYHSIASITWKTQTEE